MVFSCFRRNGVVNRDRVRRHRQAVAVNDYATFCGSRRRWQIRTRNSSIGNRTAVAGRSGKEVASGRRIIDRCTDRYGAATRSGNDVDRAGSAAIDDVNAAGQWRDPGRTVIDTERIIISIKRDLTNKIARSRQL